MPPPAALRRSRGGTRACSACVCCRFVRAARRRIHACASQPPIQGPQEANLGPKAAGGGICLYEVGPAVKSRVRVAPGWLIGERFSCLYLPPLREDQVRWEKAAAQVTNGSSSDRTN